MKKWATQCLCTALHYTALCTNAVVFHAVMFIVCQIPPRLPVWLFEQFNDLLLYGSTKILFTPFCYMMMVNNDGFDSKQNKLGTFFHIQLTSRVVGR